MLPGASWRLVSAAYVFEVGNDFVRSVLQGRAAVEPQHSRLACHSRMRLLDAATTRKHEDLIRSGTPRLRGHVGGNPHGLIRTWQWPFDQFIGSMTDAREQRESTHPSEQRTEYPGAQPAVPWAARIRISCARQVSRAIIALLPDSITGVNGGFLAQKLRAADTTACGHEQIEETKELRTRSSYQLGGIIGAASYPRQDDRSRRDEAAVRGPCPRRECRERSVFLLCNDSRQSAAN